MSTTYDFIAVGLGPFNLGLACLTEPIAELNGLFLERNDGFDWHPGMLLETSTLQTPFLSDLVTLADPTSPFSFLNYLKETGRLYSFYIRESFYPLRTEYNDYCQWAASKLATVRFRHRVTAVEYDAVDDCYLVHAIRTPERHPVTFRGRRLVLGIGTPPYVPDSCTNLGGDIVHSSRYLDRRANLQDKGSIAVIGSGQSAAEIYYDLLQDVDRYGYELSWITRSPRFFPLEYTKLTLEMTSPEYADYFHALPARTRDRLVSSQRNLYKGISSQLIDDIFELLYVKNRGRRCPTRLLTNTALAAASYDPLRDEYTLDLHQKEQDREFRLRTQALVLATGYRYEEPEFIAPIDDRIVRDADGRYAVGRNYGIDVTGQGIFVQNAELHTHGFVAPDLGMAAYRNSCIVRELLGKEYYRVEQSIAFQEFAAPEGAEVPEPVDVQH